ncbi:MAG: hypothetical protein AAF202_01725, partial [Pseudomonadota bacterium]
MTKVFLPKLCWLGPFLSRLLCVSMVVFCILSGLVVSAANASVICRIMLPGSLEQEDHPETEIVFGHRVSPENEETFRSYVEEIAPVLGPLMISRIDIRAKETGKRMSLGDAIAAPLLGFIYVPAPSLYPDIDPRY